MLVNMLDSYKSEKLKYSFILVTNFFQSKTAQKSNISCPYNETNRISHSFVGSEKEKASSWQARSKFRYLTFPDTLKPGRHEFGFLARSGALEKRTRIRVQQLKN